jgi:hypothetical protein
MKELIHRSRQLQDSIMGNKALLGELCERIAQVLDGRVELPDDQTYVFVPRVYRRPLFLPEIFVAAQPLGTGPIPRPEPGPYDPWIVKILDRERLDIATAAGPDPTPWKDLREQIMADQALLAELSDAIAGVLGNHGVALAADETYAFEAVTAAKPRFSSQLAATPMQILRPPRATSRSMALFERYEQLDFIPRWYEGVPAPELLAALETQRLAAPMG